MLDSVFNIRTGDLECLVVLPGLALDFGNLHVRNGLG